jgi:hypothetical protein
VQMPCTAFLRSRESTQSSVTKCRVTDDAGPFSKQAQTGFEFGEVHLDGIEVGAVGTQVVHTRTADWAECFYCDDPVGAAS